MRPDSDSPTDAAQSAFGVSAHGLGKTALDVAAISPSGGTSTASWFVRHGDASDAQAAAQITKEVQSVFRGPREVKMLTPPDMTVPSKPDARDGDGDGERDSSAFFDLVERMTLLWIKSLEKSEGEGAAFLAASRKTQLCDDTALAHLAQYNDVFPESLFPLDGSCVERAVSRALCVPEPTSTSGEWAKSLHNIATHWEAMRNRKSVRPLVAVGASGIDGVDVQSGSDDRVATAQACLKSSFVLMVRSVLSVVAASAVAERRIAFMLLRFATENGPLAIAFPANRMAASVLKDFAPTLTSLENAMAYDVAHILLLQAAVGADAVRLAASAVCDAACELVASAKSAKFPEYVSDPLRRKINAADMDGHLSMQAETLDGVSKASVALVRARISEEKNQSDVLYVSAPAHRAFGLGSFSAEVVAWTPTRLEANSLIEKRVSGRVLFKTAQT